MKLRRFENFDWTDNDFDFEEDAPSKWSEFPIYDDLKKYRQLINKTVRIKPHSRYYNDSYSTNPKDMDGIIISIDRDIITQPDVHSINVKWENRQTNVYTKDDLLINM